MHMKNYRNYNNYFNVKMLVSILMADFCITTEYNSDKNSK